MIVCNQSCVPRKMRSMSKGFHRRTSDTSYVHSRTGSTASYRLVLTSYICTNSFRSISLVSTVRSGQQNHKDTVERADADKEQDRRGSICIFNSSNRVGSWPPVKKQE